MSWRLASGKTGTTRGFWRMRSVFSNFVVLYRYCRLSGGMAVENDLNSKERTILPNACEARYAGDAEEGEEGEEGEKKRKQFAEDLDSLKVAIGMKKTAEREEHGRNEKRKHMSRHSRHATIGSVKMTLSRQLFWYRQQQEQQQQQQQHRYRQEHRRLMEMRKSKRSSTGASIFASREQNRIIRRWDVVLQVGSQNIVLVICVVRTRGNT